MKQSYGQFRTDFSKSSKLAGSFAMLWDIGTNVVSSLVSLIVTEADA